LNVHTNGNVAVGDFYGKVNFGTNVKDGSLDKDISYIQNPNEIASSSFVDSNSNPNRTNKVVFGVNNAIDVSTSRPSINGTYLDHLKVGNDEYDAIDDDEIYQDKVENEYVDIANYLNDFLSTKSNSLLVPEPQKVVENKDFPDPNQRFINLQHYEPNANNQIVINFEPDVLTANTPIYIYGLSEHSKGTNIIINVDTKGDTAYNVQSQIKLFYTDGNVERPNQETENFDDNHLLWNFYDSTSTSSDKLYYGAVTLNAPFQGSILAPKAEVTAVHNFDGNVAANKVNIKGESHRWDLQDDAQDNETTFEKPIVIPGEIPEEWFDKPNIENPDIPAVEEDIDKDGNLTPDENDGNEGEETGNTTDPEEPSTGEEDKDTDDGDGEETGNTTDPETPSTENPDTEKPNTGKPDPETPSTETPSTEKPGTDDKDDNGNEEGNSTDENTDGDGNIITNGGSEGTDPGTSGDLNNGLLPNVVGKNSDVSQTPSMTSNSGLLPQTGATTGILATIGGLILLAFGLILKATHIKKEN